MALGSGWMSVKARAAKWLNKNLNTIVAEEIIMSGLGFSQNCTIYSTRYSFLDISDAILILSCVIQVLRNTHLLNSLTLGRVYPRKLKIGTYVHYL